MTNKKKVIGIMAGSITVFGLTLLLTEKNFILRESTPYKKVKNDTSTSSLNNDVTPTKIEEKVSDDTIAVTDIPNKDTNDDKSFKSVNDLLNVLNNIDTNIDDAELYFCDNISKLFSTDGPTEEELYLAAYAYKKIKNANINEEDALKELNTLMIEQQYPRCMDRDEFECNFKLLLSTLDNDQSVYGTYSVLAWLIHDANCDLEHENVNGNLIKCDELEKEYVKKYDIKNEQ